VFTARTTADDVLAGVDLTGRSAIVTGASSGIGVETARALASVGAHVTLAVRDLEAGGRAASTILLSTPHARLSIRPLDLADQSSIARFASQWDGTLDILVNNAGVMATPLWRTPEGWEMRHPLQPS
jgi:NAD(P)-dependent dehydrogenase (short-subunit alcohol dehydrogenase family)